MDITGKTVTILGAGRSGRAAAALALRGGARVKVFDSAATIEGMPEEVEVHPSASVGHARDGRSDLLVVSPGIDTFGPLVAAFSACADETIGEVEFACRHFSGKVIAITGTNGKTTTTELVERILNAGGISAVACGNYGVPVCEVVMRDPVPDALALEASSFQLETVVDFKPDVAVWLNFAPDHMDRYPTVEKYKEAKLRIFENQTAAEWAVVRLGESLPELAAQVVRFSTDDESADWFSDGRFLMRAGETVLGIETGSHLRGKHNAENAMAAIAACLPLGVSIDAVMKAFDGYAPPRHRCELVRTLDGVEWLNDSKATNLHALESALRSQTRPVVLIAGGKEKGLDYRPLLPLLSEKARAAVTFGQISAPLAELLSHVVPVEPVTDLGEAVDAARRHCKRGDAVLFSPGTSSFDQFSGYEERGDTFCRLVHKLS
ncbi:UDP-N-acetylmuramoyl-L-alanine--D-glutamate ligase [Haloferula chungangensis]|uniref:UDP-N-acetylmuramoylalanine--D-glutamate ligase n=1 Tax=Haloferula chungangensis TaxID=1048331 RepID=A0ABW2L8D1_9BACT